MKFSLHRTLEYEQVPDEGLYSVAPGETFVAKETLRAQLLKMDTSQKNFCTTARLSTWIRLIRKVFTVFPVSNGAYVRYTIVHYETLIHYKKYFHCRPSSSYGRGAEKWPGECGIRDFLPK